MSDKRTIIDVSQEPKLQDKPAQTKIIKNTTSLNIPRYHWRPDKPDSRDYKYRVSHLDSNQSVDLRPYCTAIEDQGALGSCTGQAIAGAIELLNKRNGIINDVSRLFIYYYERALLNTINYDSGAYIRDGIKVISKQGAPLEKLWPYSISRFRNQPSEAAIKDALLRKVTLYERAANHNACLDAISNGYPVTIGFYVYSSFESSQVAKTGIMPYPNTNKERILGGHAVLLVGYDKTKQRYIARNSWGTGWGDKGYFYMPFQVIENTKMSGDFWVIKSVNNP